MSGHQPIDAGLEAGYRLALAPVVASAIDDHNAAAQLWYPHKYIPWSQAQDFELLPGGVPYDPSQSKPSNVLKAALIVNLMTEDNLPDYHHTLAEKLAHGSPRDRNSPWWEWIGQWTAEEGRHAYAIRAFLEATRAVDLEQLEQSRMKHMTQGYNPGEKGLLRTMAYVTFQELATRVSHRNTGVVLANETGDTAGRNLLGRIAKDENLHYVFYRKLGTAALELDPDAMMEAITEEVMGFQMPGSGLDGFLRLSALIAKAGIYGPTQHLKEVIAPVLKHWRIFERTDFGPRGEQARERLASYIVQLTTASKNFDARQARLQAARTARAE